MERPFEVRRNGKRIDVPSRALNAAAARLSPKHFAKLGVEAERAMKAYLARVTKPLLARHGGAWSASGGGANLMRRTGAGANALANAFTRTRRGMIEGVISLPFHMVQQEFGAVITAKRSYLSIPLPAALKPDGTPKKRSAREWRNTFVVKGKRGGLVICTKRGSRIIPLYALKPRVKIKARLGLRKQMRSERLSLQKDIAKRIYGLIRATV